MQDKVNCYSEARCTLVEGGGGGGWVYIDHLNDEEMVLVLGCHFDQTTGDEAKRQRNGVVNG